MTDLLKSRKQFFSERRQYAKSIVPQCKRVILIFSDLSGSSEQARINPIRYFEDTLYHMFETGYSLSSEDRIVVKTIGDEVMLTHIILPESDISDIEQALIDTIKATINFMSVLRDQDLHAKVGITLCNQVLPIHQDSIIHENSIIYEIKNTFENFPVNTGDILGSDVNLAARIMSVAEPGQILISPMTYEALPDNWKNGEIIEVGENQRISFDLQTEFFFKGFHSDYDKTEKVIQIIVEGHDNVSVLSECCYKYICITNFRLIGTRIGEDELISEIKNVFPNLSYILSLKRYKSLIPHDYDRSDDFSYPLSVVFQTRNEEDYRNLSRKLKEKTNVTSFSHAFFNQGSWKEWPILDRNCFKNHIALCLWRCAGWNESKNLNDNINKFIKSSGAKLSPLMNFIVTGYYDNFTLLCSLGDANTNLKGELNKLKPCLEQNDLLNPIAQTQLHAWEVSLYDINPTLQY